MQNGNKTDMEPIIETSSTLESITRGEVDIQVATAKRYPRDKALFRQRAQSMATRDPETAAMCEYHIPRGKGITGPSVRLAEIVASCWGNIRAEARPVSEDGKYVTSQATVWDLEHNVLYRHETRRRITDRDGRRYSDDMITMTVNAASSIAFREAVFKVIPRSEWLRVYEAAKETAIKNLARIKESRDNCFRQFTDLGISEKRVLTFIGITSRDDLGLSDLQRLSGIYTALSEEGTDVNEIFPPEDLPKGRQKASTAGKAKEESPQEESPKRKRGRPKGSKNKNNDKPTPPKTEPPQEESPPNGKGEFDTVGPPPLTDGDLERKDW